MKKIDLVKQLKSWVLPLVVAVLMFILVRPVLAQNADTGSGNIVVETVGSEVVDGFSQVYFVEGEKKNFISSGKANSTLPSTDGRYIAYRKSENGVDQIFLYDSESGSTVQVTNSGNNTNPKVDNGRIVWESWKVPEDGQGAWQIDYFDGVRTIALTNGDLSINPDISGDYVSYGRRDAAGTWRSVVYSISSSEAKEVSIGLSSKRPELHGGKLVLDGTGTKEEFPLTLDDIFLLNLNAFDSELSTPNVTSEDIQSELNQENVASESALVQ